MKLIEAIRGIVCNYADYENKIKEKEQEIYNKDLSILNLKEQNKLLLAIKEHEEGITKNQSKVVELLKIEMQEAKDGLTELDIFCQNKYQIVSKAYKDKIIINGVKMPCDLREMFTPMSSVVQTFKKKIPKSEDKLTWFRNIMILVHENLKWKREMADNYYFPCYSLTIKECDCEDGTYVQGSIEPELGNAYGFFKKEGHSFCVGLVNGYIHIFDWTNGRSEQWSEDSDYEINFIITKNRVYRVKGNVEFGDILWE